MTRKAEKYLADKYAGVFDQATVQRHVADYIGFQIAEGLVDQACRTLSPGAKVLDIGSGFGTFVLLARKRGLDALGIEIESFEVSFARDRLRAMIPDADPEYVYRMGDATRLAFGSGTFDAVTLWNVLEHIQEKSALLSEAVRVLRPGGRLYLICPNYCSIRREAHYNVFWPGLVPRAWASGLLRLYGKNPAFFRSAIFYTTNWGILRMLKRLGLQIYDPAQEKIANPELILSDRARFAVMLSKKLRLRWFIQVVLYLSFINPFKSSVCLVAKRK